MEFPVIMPTDDALITYLRIFDSRGMTKELLRKVIQVQTFTQAHGSSGQSLSVLPSPIANRASQIYWGFGKAARRY